ncbi:EF-hand calcium-binding domain-containing protein 12 [Osmerus mordax]|uniref:EF-hand calcium-binding domain-containing protein 12 n=1 Tax=Osmerus mordax TaxID=8014 RepID=UPI0035105485
MLPGKDVANHRDWVEQRRVFRKELDNIGNLSKWLHAKPTVTELEMLVVEREKNTEKIPSPKSGSGAVETRPSLWNIDSREWKGRPNSQQSKLKEIKRYLSTNELCTNEIAKRLDKHGTGKIISREDLRSALEKEGIPMAPERLDKLVSYLIGREGDSLTVKNLAKDIKDWSQDIVIRTSNANCSLAETDDLPLYLPEDTCLERGVAMGETGNVRISEQYAPCLPEQQLWNQRSLLARTSRLCPQRLSHVKPELSQSTPPQSQEEQACILQHRRSRGMEGMRDEEVLAIMKMLCQSDPRQDAHSQPSSLGGSTGLAVDRFRRQCLGEYLDTLDQCRKKGVSVSQSSLEKVLLHPGDYNVGGPERPVLRQAGSTPLPGCGGRLRGWLSWDHGATPQEEKEEQDSQEEAATHVPKLMPVYPSRRSVHRKPKMMTLSTGLAEVGHKTECWMTREEYIRMSRNKEPSYRRANPNAFWPGQDDHVRLYLPQVGISPQEVLFQHIVRSPAPSRGNWPINSQGYSTSGDIDGHKAYTL